MRKILIVFSFSILFVYGQLQGPKPEEDLETAAEDARIFNKVALEVIANRLATSKLPPESELAGQKILADAEEGLMICMELIKTVRLIWHSKVCAAAQMRNALSAVNALQRANMAVPTSSA